MKRLQITNLKQNKIKNIYVKNENRKQIVFSLFSMFFVFIISISILLFDDKLEFSKTFNQVYNPINPLYNTTNNIVFTNNDFNFDIENDKIKLQVPINCKSFNYDNGNINFVIDENVIIYSPENAIVKNIGMLLNGEKFIELKHNNNLISRIENIDVVGVIINQKINKGKEIATAKLRSVVRYSLFFNEQKIDKLQVLKNEIIWEN